MDKKAGAITYLVEELSDARVRCDQLLRYIADATKIVENSPQKEAIFEAAGHLVQAVPTTAFKLHKALQAVALAASRIDYEELKQDLRPEKVEQLENVLEDVRIRQVQHRSEPSAMTTKNPQTSPLGCAPQWKVAADLAPKFDPSFEQQLSLMVKNPPKVSENDGMVAVLVFSPFMKKYIPMAEYKDAATAEKDLSVWMKAHRETLQNLRSAVKTASGMGSGPLPRAAYAAGVHSSLMDWEKGKHWEAMESLSDWLSLDRAEPPFSSDLVKKAKGLVPRLTKAANELPDLIHDVYNIYEGVSEEARQRLAAEDPKQSRYEEGKPADPTENMSESDAKKWKDQTEAHKDEFKKEASAEDWKA
jgi:hypothetical protein